MTVKLRPGTHYAPVGQGVLVAHRDTSFVLRGPATLYELIDANLDRLLTGTDAATLAEAAGTPAATPVFERILGTLLDRGVLLDLDALAAPPSAADAQRYAATLAYCESVCADPHRSFAAVRTAQVGVLGHGPAIGPLVRSLADMGVGAVRRQERGDLTVLVDDVDHPAPDAAGAGATVTVVADALVAVVGPVTPGEDGWTRALAGRAAQWARLDPRLAAPRPLSAVLAGSLAARAVLDHLLGIAAPAAATVVHGRLLETTQIAVPGSDTPVRPDAPAGPGDAAGEPAGAVLARTAPMTSAFSGPIRRGADEDLVQLPLSLATAQAVAGGGAVVGWGTDRGSAGLDAVLRATRRWTALTPPPSAAVAVAGSTPERAELDGVLRLAAPDLLQTPGRPIGWDDVDASRPRALWSVLEDHFGRRVRLVSRALDGGPWTMVTALDDEGRSLGEHWGFSLASAAFSALGEVLMKVQYAAAPTDPVGTHVLTWAPEAAVVECLAACRARGRTWQSAPAARDEVIGAQPVRTGWVWRP